MTAEKSEIDGSAVGLGIDIGGSGIKGSLVDLERGEFTTERLKLATPIPSTPDAVAEVVAQIVEHFDWHEPFGCTFPAAIRHGVALTAANIDSSWIGTDISAVLSEATGQTAHVVNDADAAGYAETLWGAARGVGGLILVTTLGTGIGTALIHDGSLIPNTELGHIELDGKDAEIRASASARVRDDMSWQEWAGHLQRYYTHLELILRPDLFIVGGGVSRKAQKFLPLLELSTPIVAAELQNSAGIVGVAHIAWSAERIL